MIMQAHNRPGVFVSTARWRPVLACLTIVLLVGCASIKPPAPLLERLSREQCPDTVFIANWPHPEEADSLFRCRKLPERSTGSPAAYLSVWRKSFLEEAARNGLQLVWPEDGWTAGEPGWSRDPGEGSLILALDSLSVHALKSGGFQRFVQWLGLSIQRDREFGWVETHYRYLGHHVDMDSLLLDAPHSLVSRRPDTPYTLNHTDRTGLLLGQAARDMVTVLHSRAN